MEYWFGMVSENESTIQTDIPVHSQPSEQSSKLLTLIKNPYIIIASLLVLFIIFLGVLLASNNTDSSGSNSVQLPKLGRNIPTSIPVQESKPKVIEAVIPPQIHNILNTSLWKINTNQQWATYQNPASPVALDYPPNWGYFEVTPPSASPSPSVQNITGVIFKKSPIADATYNLFIEWNNTYVNPVKCLSTPVIQLKNETLPGCEYTLSSGDDAIKIEKSTSSYHITIHVTTSNFVSKDDLITILSSLSFIK